MFGEYNSYHYAILICTKGGIVLNQSTIDQLLTDFSRTTEEIISLEEFKTKLKSGKQLKIKYGVDVTAPFLHIGHAVNLWMMRKMQDMGHKVQFLIGDFTTRIGDPTGKSKTRPMIPQEEIEKNTEKFIEQVKMILRFDDPNLIEIRRNSEWYQDMNVGDFLGLLQMVTHSRLISRDMFRKRMNENEEIYMHEMIYPILQGYDSYMLQSDLTIIGSDQLFNEMMGRFYQEKFGNESQVIITTKITPGLDGVEKQSKSLNNYIGLGHSPRDKFGRIMRLPDELIPTYLRVYTNVPLSQIEAIEKDLSNRPMEYKKFLAEEIVRMYHGDEIAKYERKWFENTFSKKNVPDSIPVVTVEQSEIKLFELLKLLLTKQSNSEIRRLIQQGGVSIDNQKVFDMNQKITIEGSEHIVKVGKRRWFKVIPQK